MSEENTEVSVSKDGISLKGKKTAEIIAILSAIGVLWVGWVMLEHKAEAKETGVSLVAALKEISQSNRVLACLMATKQEEREVKLAQCERIAR